MVRSLSFKKNQINGGLPGKINAQGDPKVRGVLHARIETTHPAGPETSPVEGTLATLGTPQGGAAVREGEVACNSNFTRDIWSLYRSSSYGSMV